jgi:hypothetical protein
VLLAHLACVQTGSGAVTRFVFTDTRGGVGNTEIQARAVKLFGTDGEQLTVIDVSNPGGSNPVNQGPGNLKDGDATTKWLDFNMACGGVTCNSTLLVETSVEPAAYELIKAHDAPKRDPRDWQVYHQGGDAYLSGRGGDWVPAASVALEDDEMPCRSCWAASYGVFDLPPTAAVDANACRAFSMDSACSLTPRLCSLPEHAYRRFIRNRVADARTPVPPVVVRLPGSVKLSFGSAETASPVGFWWPADSSTADAHISAAPSWIVTPRQRWEQPCTTTLQSAVACFSFFAGNYGHTLHDLLPLIAWLRLLLPNQTLVVPASSTLQAILAHIDYEYTTKVTVIDQQYTSRRIFMVKPGTVVCASSASVVAIPANARRDSLLNFAWVRKSSVMRTLRKAWLQAAGVVNGSGDGTVIVYVRHASRTMYHGRNMTRGHAQDIVTGIERAMLQFGLTGSLVRYDGSEHGAAMPIASQAELFGRAETVIGPHGAGLANILWLPAHTSTQARGCDRPKVLEFICSERSARVQNGCPYGRTHWSFFGTAPFVQWYHQFFTADSSPATTWIDLDELQVSLRSMWSSQVAVAWRERKRAVFTSLYLSRPQGSPIS